MNYLCKSNDISIRKMEDDIKDYSLMAKWLSTGEILDYYGGRNNPLDLEEAMKKFAPRIMAEEAVVPCFMEYNGMAIGYIQYYRIEPNGYDVRDAINMKNYRLPYGIDLFIGESDAFLSISQ